MNKLKDGMYNRATPNEVAAFVEEAESLIEKYGWHDMAVHPYSYPMKVTRIIEMLKDYQLCTTGSKVYLISLANGLVDILNAWEAHELEDKVEIRIKDSGKTAKVGVSMAQAFIDEGYAEMV